ncbi:MAG TPA: hypothetical protein VK776_09125 [Bryobacteraceae bacterium]|nr:hypothetical protein [Bryobacteraceae bacterium]
MSAAKSVYIPDITAYACHRYQNDVPFLVRNFDTLGMSPYWDAFDSANAERPYARAQLSLSMTEENLPRPKRK